MADAGAVAGVLSGAVWETAGVVAGAGVVSVAVVAVLNHPHEFSYTGLIIVYKIICSLSTSLFP